MKIAYARVSTVDQSLELQIQALERLGFDKIFTDHGVSGVSAERKGLHEALDTLSSGDTFMVWRLDRIGRSMQDLVDTVRALHRRNIHFHSACEYIDVTSAFGELQLHIMSAMAHFERALIIERTREGMAAAKARGAAIGRKPALDALALEEALHLRAHGMNVATIAAHLGIGRSTLYRYFSDVEGS